MTRPLRIATINGSYSSPSKTGSLIDLVVEELSSVRNIETHRVDVAELGPGFTGALLRDDLAPEVLTHIETVENADLVVAGSPVFRASYSGLFKHFVDFLGQYSLAAKPVLLVATGGSERHALVIEHELRPLFGFFQAATAPVGIYASAGDFDRTTLLNPEIYGRIQLAVTDILPSLDARVSA